MPCTIQFPQLAFLYILLSVSYGLTRGTFHQFQANFQLNLPPSLFSFSLFFLSCYSFYPSLLLYHRLPAPPFQPHLLTWTDVTQCASCFYFFFLFSVAPVIHVPNQLVGAPLGTDVALECFVEASPKSINYWMKEKGQILKSLFFFFCHLFILSD